MTALVHVAVGAVLASAVVAAYRAIRARAPRMATVFAIGIVLRCVASAALFLISFFQLPFLRELQLGDGFWTLALDARTYYEIAVRAVGSGLGTISSTYPSPLFLRVLALWMWLVGLSPVSGALLNIVCYAIAAVAIVGMSQPDRAARPHVGGWLALAAVTFSPALLIFGTQPLKDQLCTTAIIVAIAGAHLWWRSLPHWPQRARSLGGAVAMLTVAVYVIAGIRAYAALMIIAALVGGAIYYAARARAARGRIAAAHAALLVPVWIALMLGGGVYYAAYQDAVVSIFYKGTPPLAVLDSARAGFVATGGATAVTTIAEESIDIRGYSDGQPRMLSRLRQTAVGYAVLFVPISLLKAAQIVRFSGGRGLLLISDVDTIVIDATVFASLWFAASSLRRRSPTSSLVFTSLLGLMTLSALAYVVTNYGTLFRLRLLGTTPLWLLPLTVGADDAKLVDHAR